MRLAGGLLLVAVTLAVTWAAPRDTDSLQDGGRVAHARHKRGFRANAIDRVGHGYGKRQSLAPWRLDLDAHPQTGRVIPVETFADLVADNPTLAMVLIKKYIDVDGDGYISTDELFGSAV